MIVYQSTKKGFLSDASNGIEDIIRSNVKSKLNIDIKPGSSEYESWKNSLGNAMYHVLNSEKIPEDAGIAVEYLLPRSKKRLDFVISGQTVTYEQTAVVVELKQWTEVIALEKDGVVLTRFKGGLVESTHPSYQVWSYISLLEDYNTYVYTNSLKLKSCAYLHNLQDGSAVKDSHYDQYTKESPVFLKTEKEKLQDYISKQIVFGDSQNTFHDIDQSDLKPSKPLIDSLASMLKGNKDFIMIDDQKLVYEEALSLAKKSTNSSKNVLIIEGGPGTGKSVIAINLLVEATKRLLNAKYVSKNAAPRAVFESKLSGTLTKSRISQLFSGSGGFYDLDKNTYDILIVDEAHRLNKHSGLYSNLGENQIKEIIESALTSIFFIDEDQRVTLNDIGTSQEIVDWANSLGANVVRMKLESQFRCNGSDGYLSWLDNSLQIRETANTDLNGIDYDFKVFDDPNELLASIKQKNEINNRSRMVAGYCWEWLSRKDKSLMDVVVPEHNFGMQWNLTVDGSKWIIMLKSVDQIGCIHTCQGLEVDYIGVIIGDDLTYKDGQIITNPNNRASSDRSLRGYKSAKDKQEMQQKADMIIKNTYRTLMTRGMKGCYIYCVDKELQEYFKGMIK